MSKRPFNKKKPDGKSQARGPTLPSALGLSNASSSKSKSSATGPKSKAKSDAAGYAARKARKPSLANPSGDIYEHIQPKNRRSRIQAGFTQEELTELGAENGFDPDGADGDVRERMRARLVGEFDDEDDAPVRKRGNDDDDEEEDEELDSDVAFDEEDEDRFAGFFSAKKSKSGSKSKSKTSAKQVSFAQVNLDEDEDMEPGPSLHAESSKSSRGGGNESSGEEEEEEEGEDDEFFDLLDVLDGKGDIDMGSDEEKEKKTEEKVKERPAPKVAAKPIEEEEGFAESDSGSESDVEDDESVDQEDEDDEDERMSVDEEADPAALDQLEAFVSGLDTRKRKADNEEGEEKTKKKKRVVIAEEQTEVGAESEFRVRRGAGAKLDLDDLLAPLEADNATLDALKKSTKVLTTSKTKTLSAPLAYRAQERLDREAAYEQTKEEVDKWGETMRRIREAEHLSFPLQAQSAPRASNATLTATFKPSTTLESSIDALLRKAKLRDEDIMQTEDTLLASNGVSAQEVAERRAEVRRMKELVYRAELKSRRANKIKSRVYRKIKRRAKDAVSGDVEDDAEDEEGKLKREYERAKERATLKHKRTGNWAKHAHDDVNVRKDVEDMLSRSEKLRRRIAGAASGSEEEDEEGDSDSEEDEETTKQRAFEELSRLRDEEDGGDQPKAKGVYGMKFMQDAMKRKDAVVNESLDRFIAELGEQEADDSPEADDASVSGAIIERRGGRILLRPGVSTAGLEISTKSLPSVAASDTSSVTLRSTDLLSPPPMSPIQTKKMSKSLLSQLPEKGAEMESDNPWLQRGVGEVSTKVASTKHNVIVSKDSKVADKSSYKLAKKGMEANKKNKGKEKEVDDADVEIDISGGLLLASAPSASKDKGPSTSQSQHREDDDEDDDEDDELQAQEASLLTGKRKENAMGIRAFEQRDLVARAFVGDNVVESFAEAKQREVEADAPKLVDVTIPGWGAWGGAGTSISNSKNKGKANGKAASGGRKFMKSIPGIAPSSRTDAGKSFLIVSQKRDKKASKYVINDLPYPYTSKAQYEKAMETPLGVEWNTRVGFQRGTVPRVTVRPGVVVQPLEKMV